MEETLGKRICSCRKQLGLTQDALADQLGVTAQAVSKWENDQSCPDITMLPKLAEIFDITTDSLLGVAKSPQPSADAAAPSQAPANTEVLPKWTRLQTPAAAFACWLFLTGLLSAVSTIRCSFLNLWDISIAVGIFTFGLSRFLRNFSVLRLGCAVGGMYFILQCLFIPSVADISWKLPLAVGLSLFGLDLLIAALRNSAPSSQLLPAGHKFDGSFQNSCTYDGSRFECTTCFGEGNHHIQLPLISGGRCDVAFGKLTLDLRSCDQVADGCCIDLKSAFASLEILIPKEYRVETVSSTAFGSVEKEGSSDPSGLICLHLNCRAYFGLITVRYL